MKKKHQLNLTWIEVKHESCYGYVNPNFLAILKLDPVQKNTWTFTITKSKSTKFEFPEFSETFFASTADHAIHRADKKLDSRLGADIDDRWRTKDVTHKQLASLRKFKVKPKVIDELDSGSAADLISIIYYVGESEPYRNGLWRVYTVEF